MYTLKCKANKLPKTLVNSYLFALQFLFDAFLSLIKNGKKASIVSVMPKKPDIPPRAKVRCVNM